MRISADPKSAYHDKEAGRRARISLDDVLVTQGDVVEVDDAEGWIDVTARDEAGQLIVNEAGNGLALERKHGVVRITFEAESVA